MIQGEKSYRLIEITLSSGKKIEATAEHPFYIKGKGWNPAGSLKIGQVLLLHNGTTVVVEEVDSRVRQVRVFNFSVANAHNYFVGGDGVLVHNVDPYAGTAKIKRHYDNHYSITINHGGTELSTHQVSSLPDRDHTRIVTTDQIPTERVKRSGTIEIPNLISCTS